MPLPPGPPMTLGNMRSLGVRSLAVTCELCPTTEQCCWRIAGATRCWSGPSRPRVVRTRHTIVGRRETELAGVKAQAPHRPGRGPHLSATSAAHPRGQLVPRFVSDCSASTKSVALVIAFGIGVSVAQSRNSPKADDRATTRCARIGLRSGQTFMMLPRHFPATPGLTRR